MENAASKVWKSVFDKADAAMVKIYLENMFGKDTTVEVTGPQQEDGNSVLTFVIRTNNVFGTSLYISVRMERSPGGNFSLSHTGYNLVDSSEIKENPSLSQLGNDMGVVAKVLRDVYCLPLSRE